MNADRDTTRIVRSWMRTDEYESADRVLDAVLDQLDTTPQRRATWWPVRRLPEMNSFAKYGVAAAVVVVAALLGFNYFISPNVGGPGVDTPTPSPTVIPSPIPLPAIADLEPGTYLLSNPGETASPLTATVPAGWSTVEGFIRKGESENPTQSDVYLATWLLSHVYVDACDEEAGLTETATAEAIVEALSSQAGHATTGPTADVLGGFAAERLEVQFDSAACNNDFAHLWPDAGPVHDGGLGLWPGQTMAIHVIDINGEPMVVAAASSSDASASDLAELEAVVDSIEFTTTDGP